MSTQKIEPDLENLEFQDVDGIFTYNCQLTLPISRKKVHVFFGTDSQDRLPTFSQKQFLQHVIDNFHEILLSISNELPSEIAASKDKLSYVKEQFDLYTLGIPLKIDSNPQWDLSMKNRADKQRLLANFANMTPVKVWFESLSPKSLILRILFKLLKI
jgi:hypothetical protein